MSKKIVTNLRIDRDDWLQIKAMAAAFGMSVNQYIVNLIQSISVKRELALDKLDKKDTIKASKGKKYSIWNLADLAKIKDKPMGLSDLDKIIYEE